MKRIRRITALLLCAVCMMSLPACGKKGMTYTEEELPYGATTRHNQSAYPVPIP